jgi:hypothetical protein
MQTGDAPANDGAASPIDTYTKKLGELGCGCMCAAVTDRVHAATPDDTRRVLAIDAPHTGPYWVDPYAAKPVPVDAPSASPAPAATAAAPAPASPGKH